MLANSTPIVGATPSRSSLLARLPLYAYIFYVIYTPQIGAISPLVKLIVLATIPLVLNFAYFVRGDRAVRQITMKKPVLPLILWTLIGALYVAAVILASNHMVESFEDLRVVQNSTLVLVVVNVAFIIDLLAKTGHDWLKSFEVVLWLGAAQGLFAVAGLFVPAIHDISRSFYIAVGGSNEWVLKDRIYGISSDFTYGTQVYHGILAGAAVYIMLKERRFYLVQIALVLATSLLNGRTGTLAFATMTLIILTVHFVRRLNFLALLGALGALAIAAFIITTLLEAFAPATYKQLFVFFDDTNGLLQDNQQSGNYAALVPELQKIPQGLGLIFGEGIHLYTGAAGDRTDIGFTNDLFAGGLIYIAILYVAFVVFLRQSLKGHSPLFLALLAGAIIAVLKGEMFRSTTLLFAFTFIPLVLLYGKARIQIKTSVRVDRQFGAVGARVVK